VSIGLSQCKVGIDFHIFRNNLPMSINTFTLVKAKAPVIRILSDALSGDCGTAGFWLLNCGSQNCGLQQASEPSAPKDDNIWVFPGQPSSPPTLCAFSSFCSNITSFMCAYFGFAGWISIVFFVWRSIGTFWTRQYNLTKKPGSLCLRTLLPRVVTQRITLESRRW
jgi:hypothetical protein